MATGNITSFAGDISEIGALYPFVGSETLLWLVGLALWIAWIVVQARMEKREYEEEIEKYSGEETGGD
jgi:hypothetical protein